MEVQLEEVKQMLLDKKGVVDALRAILVAEGRVVCKQIGSDGEIVVGEATVDHLTKIERH